MYCLWLAMFHSNKNIVIISIKDRVAKKVLKKIKYMYKNLPAYVQVKIVNGRAGEYGTATDIEFINGSIISSIPTTEDAGRSEAVSLLVIDEGAIVRWASTIWAAAFPTLSTGGSAIVNSTPYGMGNWYHQTWVDAISGRNNFNPIRLKWQMHPERDIKWYTEMASALGPRKTAQEIDGDFLSSGNMVFDPWDIKAIEEELPDFKPLHQELDGALKIFKNPDGGRFYIGADVATGRSRDYSAFTLMNREGEEYGVFRGKIAVDDFADLLGKWGSKFRNAQIAPEANDIGLAVVSKLQSDGYPNLHYSTKLVREKGQGKPKTEKIPGWYTTMKNRPIIIDELEEDIRNDNVLIKDPFFVQEAYTFIYDDMNRPVAMGKSGKKEQSGDELDDQVFTDDAIFGKAICNHIRKGKINTVVVAPQ